MSNCNTVASPMWREGVDGESGVGLLLSERPELHTIGLTPGIIQSFKENV